MSDNEYEMEWGSEDGNEAGGNGSDGEIEIENNYYEAESIMKA
jgi:hypothetical protein